jgi:hypothetical protein
VIQGILSDPLNSWHDPKGQKPLGFAFDRTANKFYVDLNRNLDLTDDPGGILDARQNTNFSPGMPSFSLKYQDRTGPAPVRHSVEINFYSNNYCNLTVRSGWQGDFELSGQKWRIAVGDDFSGTFTANNSLEIAPLNGPPPGRSNPVGSGSVRYNIPGCLVLNGQAYALGFKFAENKSADTLLASLQEIHPPLGQLEIEGKFISSLTLKGDQGFRRMKPSDSTPIRAYLAIFAHPPAELQLPEADYHVQNIELGAAGSSSTITGCQWDSVLLNTHLAIRPNQRNTLRIGGPLINSVTVEQMGDALRLNYKLLGQGGETYQPSPDRKNAPRFTIYKGNRLLDSGAFEYG